MPSVRLLRNPIREYAWGSHTAIAELLGRPSPSADPQAEMWIGAHPLAPSEVREGGDWVSLVEWIARDPAEVLGAKTAERFGSELPFLLKVLAAEEPLSLQAHPDAAQASAGYARENAEGIAMDAAHRIYRDPNPKPELVCALTPFAALCGFRSIDEIIAQVDELRANRLASLMPELRRGRDRAGLRHFYESLMTLEPADAASLVDEVVVAAESGYGDPAVRGWLRKLAAAHPGDPGVLAPLFLNFLELRPGEALFLPAGELHAYLHGTAIEIMASSDNVLRGGLTNKHVAVTELLATLSFEPRLPPVVTPREVSGGESVYEAPVSEFALSVVRPAEGRPYVCRERDSVEILLCTEGAAVLEWEGSEPAVELATGSAALVAADVEAYELRGSATLFRATLPSS